MRKRQNSMKIGEAMLRNGLSYVLERERERYVPAAVALPVNILTCVSSSAILLCAASSGTGGWEWDRSAPHLWHVLVKDVIGVGAAGEGCSTVVVTEDISW